MSDYFPTRIKTTETLIQEKLLRANGYQELQGVTVHQHQLQLAQLTCLGNLHHSFPKRY